MAEGLLDAATMIVGEQEGMVGIGLLESEDVESLMERIARAVEDVDTGDGVLVLGDLFGGCPFTASARVAMAGRNREVLSGVNLPMVLELLVQRESYDLRDLVEVARQAGASGIRTLSETLSTVPT